MKIERAVFELETNLSGVAGGVWARAKDEARAVFAARDTRVYGPDSAKRLRAAPLTMTLENHPRPQRIRVRVTRAALVLEPQASPCMCDLCTFDADGKD